MWGDPKILDRLREIAPVFAVRGNVDRGEWAQQLPLIEVVQVREVSLYVLHNLNELDLVPAAAGFSAVISGHSHQPKIERRNGVLYLCYALREKGVIGTNSAESQQVQQKTQFLPSKLLLHSAVAAATTSPPDLMSILAQAV